MVDTPAPEPSLRIVCFPRTRARCSDRTFVGGSGASFPAITITCGQQHPARADPGAIRANTSGRQPLRGGEVGGGTAWPPRGSALGRPGVVSPRGGGRVRRGGVPASPEGYAVGVVFVLRDIIARGGQKRDGCGWGRR